MPRRAPSSGAALFGRPVRRAHRCVLLVAVVLLLGGAAVLTCGTHVSYAAWSSSTANGGNTFSSASTYPSYAQVTLGDNPKFLLGLNEAPSSSATSTAGDVTSNGINGTYNGATNGAWTWWKFDEGSGTVAQDSSGAANPGTLGSNVSWAAGQAGTSAVSMTGGTGSYVSGRAMVDTSRSYTVVGWAYLTTSGSRTMVSQSGSSASAFSLGVDGSTGKWRANLTASDANAPTTATVLSTATAALNTWTHLALVYDSSASQLKLYVNGTLQTTASVSASWNAGADLSVGRRLVSGSWAEPWAGRVDDVRLYEHVLTATEISTLATGSGSVGAPMTAQVPSAVVTGGGYGLAFSGATGLYVPTALTATSAFTAEVWFRVSGNAGGTLRAFATDTTGTSSTKVDRVAYLDSGGHVTFGVMSGGTQATIRTPLAYNDDQWHSCATSSGPAGLKLYIDGSLVASDPTKSSDDLFTGYQRFGGVSLAGWPNRPTSDYLIGSMDSLGYYETQLADQNVAWHYHANR